MKLGILDINEVLSLPAKKFMEWEEYARLEPFDEMRADYRSALIAQMVFNMAVDKKDRKELKDFLIKWEAEEKKEKTWQEMQATARLIVEAYNAAGVTE